MYLRFGGLALRNVRAQGLGVSASKALRLRGFIRIRGSGV